MYTYKHVHYKSHKGTLTLIVHWLCAMITEPLKLFQTQFELNLLLIVNGYSQKQFQFLLLLSLRS